MLVSAFSLPAMFSTCPNTNFNFSVTCILSSANAFNLNQSKKLSFDKELRRFAGSKDQTRLNMHSDLQSTPSSSCC